MVKGEETEMSVQLPNHLHMPINHMGNDRKAHPSPYYRTEKCQILTYPVTLAKQVFPLQASDWMFAKEER